MRLNENTIHKAIMESLREFINEDGACATGGGATSCCNVGATAGENGTGNGFEYDVPVGTSKKNRGGTVMRRTFWTAGNSENTMQKADEESSDVVNKRKKK